MTLTHKLDLVGNDTLVVSPTQLEVIRTCARQWDYRYLYRRVEREVDAAKQGGKSFDAALNLRYQRCGSNPVDPATEAEMLALIDAAYEGVDLPLEEFRTPARYKEVLQAYNAYWKGLPYEVLGVQVPFALLVGEVPVPYEFWRQYAVMHFSEAKLEPAKPMTNARGSLCGTCDGTDAHEHPCLRCTGCGVVGLAENMDKHHCVEVQFNKLQKRTTVKVVVRGLIDAFTRLAEHVLVRDTKTSKNDIGNSYANSAQLKCYVWAMRELARLHPELGFPPEVHGAFIDGVVIRPPYKNENRKPTAADRPRNEFIATFPEFFTPERLEEWRADTLAHVETALGWVARGHFPQNERHCTFHMDAAFKNYGTYGKNCPYLPVCTLPVGQRPMALASDQFMDYDRGPLSLVPTPEVEEAQP